MKTSAQDLLQQALSFFRYLLTLRSHSRCVACVSLRLFSVTGFLICLFASSINAHPYGFVTAKGMHFYRYGKKYAFLGANLWYGMNLGASNKARLVRELDRLQRLGIRNLRILAASEGPDTEPWRIVPSAQPLPGKANERLLKGLDFLLHEMRRRDMTAVVVLGNYWHWSGGFAQYLNWAGKGEIPYPDFDPEASGGNSQSWSSYWMWLRYNLYTTQFYSNKQAMELYEKFIRRVITRRNTINGLLYAKDSAIMAWQLANEPAGFLNADNYDAWILKTARLIKSLDANHLVSTGAMGEVFSFAGVEQIRNNTHKEIDYTTVHIWVQNGGMYNPQRLEETYPKALVSMHDLLQRHREFARTLKKPLVLEEFGISRDWNKFAPGTPVTLRDNYYAEVFRQVVDSQKTDNPVAGVNFWAWAGEGNPSQVKWKPGDPLTGDPPHEAQGWYSVYESDQTTHAVIATAAKQLNLIR